MAGCECEVWRKIMKPRNTEEEEIHRELRRRIYYDILAASWVLFNCFILNCPWCGSKLTEEAGDAAGTTNNND